MYTVDYFIKKFEAIPDQNWGEGNFGDFDTRKCAGGHCGATENIMKNKVFSEELTGLANVFSAITYRNSYCYTAGELGSTSEVIWNVVTIINDGSNDKYQQDTPKQRILAALYDIKKSQEPKVKEVIRYVAVDAQIRSSKATEDILQSTFES